MRRLLSLLALATIATVVGCTPKLDEKHTFTIDSAESKEFTLPAVRAAQKIKVDVQATGGNVDVFAYLEKNKVAAQKEIFAKGGPNLLAEKRGIEAATFEVAVPAAESTVIAVVGNLKKANVTLKLTN